MPTATASSILNAPEYAELDQRLRRIEKDLARADRNIVLLRDEPEQDTSKVEAEALAGGKTAIPLGPSKSERLSKLRHDRNVLARAEGLVRGQLQEAFRTLSLRRLEERLPERRQLAVGQYRALLQLLHAVESQDRLRADLEAEDVNIRLLEWPEATPSRQVRERIEEYCRQCLIHLGFDPAIATADGGSGS